MRHFGLVLENGKVDLMDLETGEILVQNDRYLIGWYLRLYEDDCTLTLIQGLTNSTPSAIIKKNKRGNDNYDSNKRRISKNQKKTFKRNG